MNRFFDSTSGDLGGSRLQRLKGHGASIVVVFALVAGFAVAAISPAEAQPFVATQINDADDFDLPTSPGLGYAGFSVRDSVIEGHHPSVLRNVSEGFRSAPLCASLNDSNCDKGRAWFYAILPTCEGTASIGCVESVSATGSGGVAQSGNFQRYFPSESLGTFMGDSAAGVPSGSMPGVWNLPNAAHAGGTEYLAVAVVSGYSPPTRNGLEDDLSIRVSLFPVAFIPGWFGPRTPTLIGNSVESPGEDQSNCVSTDVGFCAARQEFPRDMRFGVTLRLSPTNVPAAWFHGRMHEPKISFTRESTVVRLAVDALPVEVPSVAVWAPLASLPSAVRAEYEEWHRCCTYVQTTCTLDIECLMKGEMSDSAVAALDSWRPVYGDKSTWSRSTWSFGSEQRLSNRPDTIGCMRDKGVLYGFVTTNAAGYVGGPPEYISGTSSFRYLVASPHSDQDGADNVGRYSMALRSDTARCLYGSSKGQVSAEVSIVNSANGTTTAAITNVANDGNWLSISATGFSYSSQRISVVLKPVVPTGGLSSSKNRRPVTITCVRGTRRIKVTAPSPSCPKGFKKV